MKQPSDDEVKARLTQIADAPPCDGWHHVLTQLRAGRVYWQKRSRARFINRTIDQISQGEGVGG